MSKENDKALQDADQETKNVKKSPKEKKKINTRKLKYGSLATAFTVVVTAVIVLVNILAVQLTERFDLKIDTTREQLYEISPETLKYLKTIEEPVEIAVMANEGVLDSGDKLYKLVKEVTDKYEVNSDKITVNYYDTEKNPEVVTRFSENYQGSIRSGDIVISCGSRVKVITMSDLYEFSTDSSTGQSYIKGIKADRELTSAIMFVADPTPPVVAFLNVQTSDSVTPSLQNLQSVIERNGYTVKTIDPLTEEISSDIAMLILPSPRIDLMDDVIKKIDSYLYNDGKLGKTLFYFAGFDQAKTPKIDAFLEEWGIRAEESCVYETNDKAVFHIPVGGLGGVVDTPMSKITDPDSKALVSDEDIPIIAPCSREMTLLFDNKDDRETKAIVTSSATSVAITNETANSPDKITDDQKYSRNILVAGSKHIYENTQKISSNVIAAGSAYIFDYYTFNHTSIGNQELLINLTNVYTGKNNGIVILSKNFENTSFYLSEETSEGVKHNIRLIVIFIIPLAVVVTGLVVFIRRRNR